MNTCYRLDFSIDFNIIEVEEIRKVIQLICVTSSSKVNRRSHMIFFNKFDIHDL